MKFVEQRVEEVWDCRLMAHNLLDLQQAPSQKVGNNESS